MITYVALLYDFGVGVCIFGLPAGPLSELDRSTDFARAPCVADAVDDGIADCMLVGMVGGRDDERESEEREISPDAISRAIIVSVRSISLPPDRLSVSEGVIVIIKIWPRNKIVIPNIKR